MTEGTRPLGSWWFCGGSLFRLWVCWSLRPLLWNSSAAEPHPSCIYAPQQNASVASLWTTLRHSAGAPPSWEGLSLADLRRGIRARPSRGDTIRLLDRLQTTVAARGKTPPVAAPLRVVVATSDDGSSPRWIGLLEARIRASLHPNYDVGIEIKDLPLDPEHNLGRGGETTTTTTTSLLKRETKRQLGLQWEDVDVLVDALAVPTMHHILGGDPAHHQHNNRTRLFTATPDVANNLRSYKQDWIRSYLLADEDAGCEPSPVLLLLDDVFVAETTPLLPLADSVYTRTVGELADWYRLPLVSVGAMLRPKRARMASGLPEMDTDEATAVLLAFALADFLLGACSEPPADTASLLVPLRPGTRELAEHVPPPPLEASLALNVVSEAWREEASRRRCPTKQESPTNDRQRDDP